jgi:hypothetical protein
MLSDAPAIVVGEDGPADLSTLSAPQAPVTDITLAKNDRHFEVAAEESDAKRPSLPQRSR